jgi:hypothetical protein
MAIDWAGISDGKEWIHFGNIDKQEMIGPGA